MEQGQHIPLRTCPFCGGEPFFVFRKLWQEWFVACPTKTCNSRVGFTKRDEDACKTKAEAADRWNRRMPEGVVVSPQIRQV